MHVSENGQIVLRPAVFDELAHFGLNPKASNLNLAVFDALAHVGVPVHDRLVRCTRPDV